MAFLFSLLKSTAKNWSPTKASGTRELEYALFTSLAVTSDVAKRKQTETHSYATPSRRGKRYKLNVENRAYSIALLNSVITRLG